MSEPQPLLGKADAVPRRRWRWLLPLVIVVAVVALAGSLVARLGSGDPVKSALGHYLTAVEAGDITQAYGLLCVRSTRPSRTEFATEVRKERQNFGGVKGHRLGETNHLPGGDATVRYTVVYQATYRFYEARLTKTNGRWLVCGFNEISGSTDTGGSATTR
jgi:hypothetical protein